MSTTRQRDRCRERLEGMSRSSVSVDAFQHEAVLALRSVIGFDRWCWPLADPATLIPGVGVADHDYGPMLPRALELEFGGQDVATKDTIARRRRPVGSLSTDTLGDLARSARWDEVLRPVGIGDTAILACRDAYGCWGWFEAHRDSSDGPVADDDLTLLADVAPTLALPLRRALASREPGEVELPPSGTIVLDEDLRLLTHTEPARRWLDLLPAAQLFASWGMLPAPLYPVATLAREGASHRAHTLVPAMNGTWVTIEAAPLVGTEGDIAVTLRSPTPMETLDVLSRAHGLTRRERQLVTLLVGGLDTSAIMRRLSISQYTIQDHLKSVFAKTGARSRREVVAALSGDHLTASHTPNGRGREE
jgi:DNA-binding CsgD family transcriptional regulator